MKGGYVEEMHENYLNKQIPVEIENHCFNLGDVYKVFINASSIINRTITADNSCYVVVLNHIGDNNATVKVLYKDHTVLGISTSGIFTLYNTPNNPYYLKIADSVLEFANDINDKFVSKHVTMSTSIIEYYKTLPSMGVPIQDASKTMNVHPGFNMTKTKDDIILDLRKKLAESKGSNIVHLKSLNELHSDLSSAHIRLKRLTEDKNRLKDFNDKCIESNAALTIQLSDELAKNAIVLEPTVVIKPIYTINFIDTLYNKYTNRRDKKLAKLYNNEPDKEFI